MTIPAPREWRRADYLVSTEPSLLDIDAIHAFLTRSSWAEGIDKETVRQSSPTACASACITAPDKSVSPGWSPITPPSAICATFTCWRRIKKAGWACGWRNAARPIR